MKKIVIATTIFLLVLSNTINAYADIVFPAIANQFAITFVVGFYWSILIALLILIVEAFFIKKLLSLNNLVSFILSFIINFISSFVGFFIVSFTFSGGGNIFAYGNMRIGTYLGLLPGYVLTVLIEGLLLVFCAALLKKNIKRADCYKMSAVMNLCSYLILLVSIMIADYLTNGLNFH